MNRWLLLSAGFISAALLSAGLAFGQTAPQPKATDCKKGAPEHVAGQVIDVTKDGKMTVRDDNGQTHQFQVSKDHHSVTFLFKNYGKIDGVNFHTHCAPSIKFAFQSDGKTTPPNHIVIGKHNAHPQNNPFTVNRHPAATTTTSSSTTSSSSSTTTTTM